MVITISHLTRMRPPYVCAAGLYDKYAVRAVTAGQLHKRLLRSNGGPFAIGAVVDLGVVKDVGTPPELEDCSFNPSFAKYVAMEDGRTFWKRLEQIAHPTLDAIFGDDLIKQGRSSCAVSPGCGMASLGCLKVYGTPKMSIRGLDARVMRAGLRLAITDPFFGKLDLGITDVRFFEDDFITVNEDVVESTQKRIDSGVRLLLSVGLTRGFPRENPVHWLQVNNLHLEDNPTWNL